MGFSIERAERVHISTVLAHFLPPFRLVCDAAGGAGYPPANFGEGELPANSGAQCVARLRNYIRVVSGRDDDRGGGPDLSRCSPTGNGGSIHIARHDGWV